MAERRLTRQELAKFLPSQKLVAEFERLLNDVTVALPTSDSEVRLIAENALALATSVRDIAARATMLAGAAMLALESSGDGDPGPPGPPGRDGAPGLMGAVMLPDDPPEPACMCVPHNALGQRFLREPTAAATADQAIAAATLTLIAGTSLAPRGFYVGQVFRWRIAGDSGAAGTAANTITVRIGTANTTADAAVASFTTPVGTAATSDFDIEVVLTIRTLGAAATAGAQCSILNSAAGGFINAATAVIRGSMSTFDSTVAGQFVHVDLTTGAAKTATVQQAFGEVVGPQNHRALALT